MEYGDLDREGAVPMDEDKQSWVLWLQGYGADKFFDAFVAIAQGAQGHCIHCGEAIYLDIVEGGGIPDWKTDDGDYGCFFSPDTIPDEGAGSHSPIKLQEGGDSS